jgi:hypothetical protein
MKTRLLALALSAFTLANARADAPVGSFEYDLNSTNAPLWDLSGPLEFNQEIIAAAGAGVPMSLPLTVDQNIRGRIDGAGIAGITVGTNIVSARYRVDGKIYTASNRTKVKLNVRATGRDVISGVTNNFRILVVYQLIVNNTNRQLVGTARGTAKFSQLVDGRVRQVTAVQLPDGNDGSWVLKLDLNSAQPPGGNASITLPNGRFLQYAARGRYSASRDSTRMLLDGFGNAEGTKLYVNLGTTNAILTSLTGRVFGQKLNVKAPLLNE